ncbi:epidermal growth factor receptor substrate 15-like 1 [Pyrus ussuriensis x Pyrus communis]|uniref:Epidermal growth factor receptor substrate 15-like 1 n=1 Tax=Pyrus ussuriensis x Pyrus communis TaxID=2448454 RepID=A0A5N5G2W8_9ROSA|nr:epidermal growth factor receptor substrate 15-like 1 [Pyrus ussuriensis x Pyrus communis]
MAMASAQIQSENVDLFDEYFQNPIWTAMAGLVAMKLWLSSRAPVSPNRSLLRSLNLFCFLLVAYIYWFESVLLSMGCLYLLADMHMQTKGRLVSLAGQSFTMPLD